MLSKELNTQLVYALKECIGSDNRSLLIEQVMDILNLERKTAYRRISGQVPFSFLEAVTLANHLKFSLDKFSLDNSNKKIVFELGILTKNKIKQGETVSFIKDMLQLFNEHYATVRNSTDNSHVFAAYNMLPPEFYLKYDTLTRFSVMRWLHKFKIDDKLIHNLDEITVPKQMRSEQLRLVSQFEEVSSITLIISFMVFKNLMVELDYFYNMGVLTDENVAAIKVDLLAVLQDMKDIAFDTKPGKKSTVDLYISNICFESSLIYFKSNKLTNAIFTVFYINYISTKDEYMIKVMENWQLSLKRGSTLISGASDIYKYKFFLEQERIIKEFNM